MSRNLKSFLIGNPLTDQELSHQRLPKFQALAVYSSDAISSCAYATDEILIALAMVGGLAMDWSLPIALAISLLLIMVIISYRQTIHAYPSGGGAYIVAKENLGETYGLVAGAALLVDYLLTVAVSVSAGIAAITSAFPHLANHAVSLCIVAMTFLMIVNLRGVKESAKTFALPTYVFIFSIYGLIVVGLIKAFQGELLPMEGVPLSQAIHFDYPAIGMLLILRAFSSGCSALTGVEAISNGVQAFKKPESRNATITLVWMGLILGSLFIGITIMAHLLHIHPNDTETVISQIARQVFGTTWFYYLIQGSTMLILVLAANTAFNDFPRLSSILASDRYLPRQLANLGDRLVFSNGILILGVLATLLIILFEGDTHLLIPLYSVGVFISFTLSQSGMALKLMREKEKGWPIFVVINSIGALSTLIVLAIVTTTKFTHGAWIIILLIPIIVIGLKKINFHYRTLGLQLQVKDKDYEKIDQSINAKVLIPVSGIHRGLIRSIRFARTITSDITALCVDINSENTRRLQQDWTSHNPGVPLVVLPSPFRSLSGPLLIYISGQINEAKLTDREIILLVPEFVTAKWWHHFLHNQTAVALRTYLWFKYPELVVMSVRHRLRH